MNTKLLTPLARVVPLALLLVAATAARAASAEALPTTTKEAIFLAGRGG
jgi:hypothetical protein